MPLKTLRPIWWCFGVALLLLWGEAAGAGPFEPALSVPVSDTLAGTPAISRAKGYA